MPAQWVMREELLFTIEAIHSFDLVKQITYGLG